MNWNINKTMKYANAWASALIYLLWWNAFESEGTMRLGNVTRIVASLCLNPKTLSKIYMTFGFNQQRLECCCHKQLTYHFSHNKAPGSRHNIKPSRTNNYADENHSNSSKVRFIFGDSKFTPSSKSQNVHTLKYTTKGKRRNQWFLNNAKKMENILGPKTFSQHKSSRRSSETSSWTVEFWSKLDYVI